MKIRITADDLAVPAGTIMEVGKAAPKAWDGKYEAVDEPRPVPIPRDTPVPVDHPPRPRR